MNKKYLPSALILYLNYFIHGVDVLSRTAVIKEALANRMGCGSHGNHRNLSSIRSWTTDRPSFCRTSFQTN